MPGICQIVHPLETVVRLISSGVPGVEYESSGPLFPLPHHRKLHLFGCLSCEFAPGPVSVVVGARWGYTGMAWKGLHGGTRGSVDRTVKASRRVSCPNWCKEPLGLVNRSGGHAVQKLMAHQARSLHFRIFGDLWIPMHG